MVRSRWSLVALVVLGLLLGGCSSDAKGKPDRPSPTTITVKEVSCDHDRTSEDAKDTIERVGGLVFKDFVVRFSQSTRLGVVALVEGDTEEAFDELSGTYGVTVVARIDDDGSGRVTGFQQVSDLVASICD